MRVSILLMKEGGELGGCGCRWFEDKVKMPEACFGNWKVNMLRQLGGLVEICMYMIKPRLFHVH